MKILSIDELTRVNESNVASNANWEAELGKFFQKCTMRAGGNGRPDRSPKWGLRRQKPGDTGQNINLLVEVSGGLKQDIVKTFVDNVVGNCDKHKFSGINLVPFTNVIENKHVAYYDAADCNTDEITGSVTKAVANAKGTGDYETGISACVDYILDDAKANRNNVYVVFTDGQYDAWTIEKLNSISGRVMFVLYGIGDDFNKMWCSDPKYKIQKCVMQ